MREDVQALDCDFFVFSGHKVFAPTGIGVVYAKGDLFDTTPPWQGGGSMILDVTFEKTVYNVAPARSRRAPAASPTPWGWERRWIISARSGSRT
jgi:selenocysteine lyase/cysteine desulfurase